jgi:tetratricopeptide (TPR) repeat protein
VLIVVCGVFIAGVIIGWHRGEVWYRLHAGKAAVERRDADAAVEWLVPVLTLAPGNAEAHFWLARAHRRRGDMLQVRSHLERAAALGFPRDRLSREEWLAMAQSGQMREATPHLSDLLIQPGTDGPDICEAFVNGFFLTCRFQEGLELLDVWQAEYPQDAQPWLFRGRYLTSIGNTPHAVEAYRAALGRDPERADLRLLLAKSLVELHEFDEASTLLTEVLDAAPDNVDALECWSECLLEQGRSEEAAAVLSRLMQRDPRHARGRLTLARSQTFSGQVRDAVALAREVVDERPFDIQAHYVLGVALRASGEVDAAAPHFEFVETARARLQAARRLIETVVTQEPDNVAARYEVGRTLLEYDAPQEGAGWLQSVLDLDPEHQASHAALAEYYSRRGNLQLAEQHRRQLLPSSGAASGDNPG